MFNVIGCNVGKLTNVEGVGDQKDDIANEIRDATKSLLRGVVDYKADPESEGHWYPDPSLPTGGQKFNVYNLDPFVWFVHKKLGLSGYGFSVDDDVADVGADLATKLQVGIASLGDPGDPNALPQKAEWTYGAPYGPVASMATVTDLSTISLLDKKVFWQVFFTDKNAGFVGALVNGPGVRPGTRVASRIESGNTFALDQPLDSSQVTPGSAYGFAFYGPVTGTGNVASATPRIINSLDPDVIAQLNVIGPGVRVAGPGVARGTKVLRVNVTNNTVELDRDVDSLPVSGIFTFS